MARVIRQCSESRARNNITIQLLHLPFSFPSIFADLPSLKALAMDISPPNDISTLLDLPPLNALGAVDSSAIDICTSFLVDLLLLLPVFVEPKGGPASSATKSLIRAAAKHRTMAGLNMITGYSLEVFEESDRDERRDETKGKIGFGLGKNENAPQEAITEII